MTTGYNREQMRKMAVKFLKKIYEEDTECLAAILTAQGNENWGLICCALENVASFIIELKRAIR